MNLSPPPSPRADSRHGNKRQVDPRGELLVFLGDVMSSSVAPPWSRREGAPVARSASGAQISSPRDTTPPAMKMYARLMTVTRTARTAPPRVRWHDGVSPSSPCSRRVSLMVMSMPSWYSEEDAIEKGCSAWRRAMPRDGAHETARIEAHGPSLGLSERVTRCASWRTLHTPRSPGEQPRLMAAPGEHGYPQREYAIQSARFTAWSRSSADPLCQTAAPSMTSARSRAFCASLVLDARRRRKYASETIGEWMSAMSPIWTASAR